MVEASGYSPTCKDLLPAVSFVPCVALQLWPGGYKHMRTGRQLVMARSWLAGGAHSWLWTDQAIDQSTGKATPLCWVFLYFFVITSSAKKFPVLGDLKLYYHVHAVPLLQAQLNLISNLPPCFFKVYSVVFCFHLRFSLPRVLFLGVFPAEGVCKAFLISLIHT